MTSYTAKSEFQHDEMPSLGILVANLGTPDAPTTPALRRYLREFLSDPRVIELPRWKWYPVLYGIVLRTRPKKSAAAYEEVWTEEGSPLLRISERQVEGIRKRLEARSAAGPIAVELGMRYGQPSIASALRKLRDAGARRLLVLPMYPQYSASTTGSTWDALSAELTRWRWVPELRFIGQYHDEPLYIEALARSIREHWSEHGKGEFLLFSFHGVPVRYLHDGDPYHCQCHKTARLVAEELELPDDRWMVSFQSRFGNEEWLKPYTDETVIDFAKGGMKTLDVICAGFSADCLETLEEIEGENAEYFEENGGEELRYIRCLNDRSDHLDMLTELLMEHVQGWPEAGGPPRGLRDPDATMERAKALGSEV